MQNRASSLPTAPPPDEGTFASVDSPRSLLLDTSEGAAPSSMWPNTESNKFNLTVGMAIILNAVIIGLETEFGEMYFVAFEHFFCLFFLLEMFLRLRQTPARDYFTDPSSCFDFFLVITGMFSLYIAPFLPTSSSTGMAVSMLRLLRMARVLRLLRVFKLFRGLSIILGAFSSALTTVLWVGALMTIMDYVLAVFLTQTIGRNASVFGDKEDEIIQWFGDIGSSMRTLFIIMTLAEWDKIAMTVAEVYPSFAVFSFAMFYIIIAAYTMASLITGIISDKLIAAQQADMETRTQLQEEERAALAEQIYSFLAHCDADGNGYLTAAEVSKALQDYPNLHHKLATVDIHIDNEGLDRLMGRLTECDGGEEGVWIEDVAEGLMQLKGVARASEIFYLKHQMSKFGSRLERLEMKIDILMDRMGGRCSNLRGTLDLRSAPGRSTAAPGISGIPEGSPASSRAMEGLRLPSRGPRRFTGTRAVRQGS
mmetsp:Transcript_25039/g.56802  ORF Transcript_25039/g.56802 Transcript_25039/m.56802 type:complete len:481 (+) Transcript_25039:118-1560(+)